MRVIFLADTIFGHVGMSCFVAGATSCGDAGAALFVAGATFRDACRGRRTGWWCWSVTFRGRRTIWWCRPLVARTIFGDMTWNDATSHHITWHDVTRQYISQPTTNHITAFHLATNHVASHTVSQHITSPTTTKTATHKHLGLYIAVVIALRTFSRQILSLPYSFFPFETSTPPLPGSTCIQERAVTQETVYTKNRFHQKPSTPQAIRTKEQLYTRSILHQTTSTTECEHTRNTNHLRQSARTRQTASAHQRLLHQETFYTRTLTQETGHTKNPLHFCTRGNLNQNLLQQNPTKYFYTKQLFHRALHQKLFIPEASCIGSFYSKKLCAKELHVRHRFSPETHQKLKFLSQEPLATGNFTPEGLHEIYFVRQRISSPKHSKIRGTSHQRAPIHRTTRRQLYTRLFLQQNMSTPGAPRTFIPKSFHTRTPFALKTLHTKDFYTKI